jgi:hypothetical protein
MNPEIPDYSDVFEQLNKHDVRYVVVGSFAAALQGYVRTVRDLDIAISAQPEEANRALGALAAIGFVSTIPLPVPMVTVLRLFDASAREINTIVRPYVPFAELLDRSQQIAFGKTSAHVASVPDLIRAKETTALPGDLEDVKHLSELLHLK